MVRLLIGLEHRDNVVDDLDETLPRARRCRLDEQWSTFDDDRPTSLTGIEAG